MSKTVDERVVSMQFDNKNFEKNVSTSMSTLEKLKQKLSFKGATKGLESIDSASKKVNMTGLANAVDTVSVRFSALQIAGTTALANITNSAINTAKRMVSAFTLDPITSGLQEYETQINAVQTILANTQHEGTNIKQVNAALDELNEYADMTIYNFTEMTRNIGTFTAAGVGLNESVNAIKGIANLAAVSGSTSYQASTAMYQLSQALAAGRVSLMDWNSVVNAGMGGKVFQDALKRTATQMGTNVDALIEKYGSFRESLTEGGWLTAEVLTETLSQFAGAYSEADLIQQGYSESQAKEIVKMAETATDAATKVKTFTQLMDTTKEALGSGWAQTWRILFGDFEQAKELWTGISDVVTGFITKMSDARNNLLEGALSKTPFDGLAKKIDKVTKATDTVTKATKKYGEIADKIIAGDYGNGQSRFDKLTKEGLDWAHAQNLVNEKLGDATRHATDYKESQDQLNKSQATTIEQLIKMSDAQLKSLGFTKEEVSAFRELEDQSKRTGIPLKDLLQNLDQLNGRTLLLNSLKNILQPIQTILKSVGEAWRDAFPPMQSETLYNAIAAFHKFTTYLTISEENAKNLTRTLKGVFAIIDLVSMVVGGGLTLSFKVAAKVIETVWKALGLGTANILEITATIGDAIVAFRDWIDEHNILSGAIEVVVPAIINFVKWIGQLVSTLYKVSGANKVVSAVINVFKEMAEYISNIDFSSLGQSIIDGLSNGLAGGAQAAWNAIIEVANGIKDKFCSLLGIHSPSTVFEGYGRNIIEGLVNGISSAIGLVLEAIAAVADSIINFDYGTIGDSIGSFFTNIFDKVAPVIKKGFDLITKTLSSIKMEHVLAGVGLVGLIVLAKQIIKIIGIFDKVSDGISNVFEKFGDVLSSTSKLINAKAGEIRTQSLLNIAKSIGIIVAALVALTLIDQNKLSSAIATLVLVTAGLLLVTKAASQIGDAKGIGKLGLVMMSLAVAITIMSAAARIIGGMNADELKQGLLGIAGIVSALVVVIGAFGLLVKGKSAQNIGQLGGVMLKLSIALLLMSGAMKILGNLDPGEMIQGGIAITAFVGIVALISKITTLAGKNASKLGSSMIKLTIAMGLMVGVIKLISGLEPGEIIKGSVAILAFVGIFGALAAITNLAKGSVKLGGTLLGMSASMLVLVGVIKLVSGLSVGEIAKGMAAISVFAGFMTLFVRVIGSLGPQVAKVGGTLLAMSVSIGILAAISIALSLVSVEGLIKGVTAVTLLGTVMALMIASTRGASDCRKNIMMMAIAIGVMAASVAALSVIDTGKLIGATASISVLMGMFALMSKASSVFTGSIGSMLVLTAVVGMLAGVLAVLSSLDVKSVLSTALSLSTLLMAMSAAMLIMSKSATVSPMALVAIGAMTIVVGLLGGLLYLLSDLPIESTLGTVAALSTLLLAMSAALLVASAIGTVAGSALAGIGVLGVFIAAITGVMWAMGAIFTPEVEATLDNGIRILGKIGYGLGNAIGSIIGGFAAGATSGLPAIGSNLSGFIQNAKPFFDGIGQIDAGATTGVEALAKTILTLTGANILESLTSWFTGGTSFADFGAQLQAFGSAMVGFSQTVSGNIDEGAVTAAANAGRVMAEMAKTIPNSGGVLGFFAGENDLSTFGSQLSSFGTAIAGFSKTVSGNIDEGAVTAAANAGRVMSEMANTIPNSGGVLGFFAGDNDLGTFGSNIQSFGKAIADFSQTVSGNIDEEAVTAAANAGKVMVALQSAVPESGGVKGFLFGDNDLGSFGKNIKQFGKGIADFSESVTGIDTTAVASATTAARSLITISQLTVDMEMGDIGDFGSNVKKLGKAIANFAEAVTGIDTSSISLAVSAARSIINISNMTSGIQIDGVANFVDAAKNLAKVDLNSFTAVDVGAVSSYASAARSLISVIKSMSGIDASGASSFASAVNSLAGANMSGITSAFSQASPQMASMGSKIISSFVSGMNSSSSSVTAASVRIISQAISSISGKASMFRTTGSNLITQLAGGMSGRTSAVTGAVASIMSSASATASGYYSSFYSAGANLAAGFAAGISANSYMAAARASAMASAAAAAARSALAIHSPSRVMYEIGDFAGKGFINALSTYASISGRAGSEMANSTISGLKDTLSNMGSVIDSGIDINPTIRPILDMSDVRSGLDTINGISGLSPSLSVLASVRGINSAVNSRNQNGANDDVISELKRLRTGIREMPRNSYNINGITYDDGSAIGQAVSALVRAARIEGRV